MVEVTVEVGAALVLEIFDILRLQSLGEDLPAFIGLAPARRAAAIEHGDPHQLAHRRTADNADFAALAAREEGIIFVELAGLHFVFCCSRPCCGRRGPGLRLGRRDAAHPGQRGTTCKPGRAGSGDHCGRAEQIAPAQV